MGVGFRLIRVGIVYCIVTTHRVICQLIGAIVVTCYSHGYAMNSTQFIDPKSTSDPTELKWQGLTMGSIPWIPAYWLPFHPRSIFCANWNHESLHVNTDWLGYMSILSICLWLYMGFCSIFTSFSIWSSSMKLVSLPWIFSLVYIYIYTLKYLYTHVRNIQSIYGDLAKRGELGGMARLHPYPLVLSK